MTRNATLDAIRSTGRPSAAGLREVAAAQGAMLRQLKGGTTPAPRATTDGVPAGKMLIPADLDYATVDALLMRLKPCLYALRKADGTVSFFEVSEYRGAHRIQLLAGSPGGYQRYPMKLKMQYMAIRHLLDDPDGAIALYGQEANECARCRSLGRHSPLTDATSRATGLGPICRGYWS